MRPDELELELVHALQVNPRASWRTLGTVLEVSPTVLGRMWEQLSAEGLAWITAVPFGRSRPGMLTFVAITCAREDHQRVLDYVAGIAEVVSIEEPARDWDLILTVLTPTVQEYLHNVAQRFRSIGGSVRYETIACTRVYFSGHEWRLNALSPAQQQQLRQREGAQPKPPPRLRPAELALLPLLHRDGRASVADIAETIGTHPSTASRRLQRVLASGRVSLRCDVAPELLGAPVSCQWFCSLPLDQHAPTGAALRAFPNLRFCASTTGSTNFTFVMWVRAPEEIFDIEWRVLERFTDLKIHESSITIRFLKRMGWMLDVRGRRIGEPLMPIFVP